jgi:hypothetical protein
LRFEKKQILITVKAYPNPSAKYGETVCCAGVDLNNFQFVRLYPVPFRDLDSDKKFKKYSIIEVDCAAAQDDKRPESYKIRYDSIKVIKWIDSKDNWSERKSIVLNLPQKPMCQVYYDAKIIDISLGFIKPSDISFDWAKHSISNKAEREACYAQLSFFNKQKDVIEEIPYYFYYNFKCKGEDNCPGHRLSIIDWEIGQAFRNWRFRYPTEKILLNKIEQKWLEISNIMEKDVYFFVGNMKRFRNIFMVLGVFYPPI